MVISREYHEGLYYLQGKVTKAEVKVPREEKVSTEARKLGKGAEKSVKGAEKKKSRNVTFSRNLIQGPTPYGYKWKGSVAQGGDSSMTGKSGENESKVSSEESGEEPKVAKGDKGKTKKKSSRRRNQKLDGFKKDSRCCISSSSGSENATGLDEIEAATRFLFEVSETEYESLIKAEGSTQDQKHARSKQ
ncbi:PREDICTED: uncharacterized protein LOC106344899 [Brassica oleracea var. oleracea]|uniref:uncharacterized protein LOC106344899 n=1 Tax=Brassica oleracea var. oleracea TaxID=109376 RepID=UPI0006A6AC3A|nr:PREDICTED: uncharacterized protein LOC106344899 [Brassica oleracea var. oleracea]